jgi:arsenate reductase-like glutaredoxin family protein
LDKINQQNNDNNKLVGESDNQRLTTSIDVLLQSKESKELKEVLPIKEEDLEQLLNKLPKELQSKVKKTKQTVDKEDDSWKIDFIVELNRTVSRQIPSKSDRVHVSIPSEKSLITEEDLDVQLEQFKEAEERRQKVIILFSN